MLHLRTADAFTGDLASARFTGIEIACDWSGSGNESPDQQKWERRCGRFHQERIQSEIADPGKQQRKAGTSREGRQGDAPREVTTLHDGDESGENEHLDTVNAGDELPDDGSDAVHEHRDGEIRQGPAEFGVHVRSVSVG
ncbi:hypothetical protein GCM10009670_02160 [Citricoccus alkalitolerans]